jgi:DNA-binding XRE family transcriptional regulator
MNRPLTPCEQFLYNRSHDFAKANPDPILYGVRLSGFFHELACAAAVLLGETASPLQINDFNNVFWAKLAQIQHGVSHDVRLAPYVTQPEPVPAPEDIPAYVANLALPLTTPPAPAATVEPHQYRRGGLRGHLVGPAYLSPAEMKAKRKALGWTQDQLGLAAELSGSFVGNLECGQALGQLKHYKALRRALNLPIPGEPQ